MSLQYGFNLYGRDKDSAKWQAKFDALSETEKDFYHNNLPWALMMADLGHVSAETIPVLAFRIAKVSEEFIPTLAKETLRDVSGPRMTESEYIAFLGKFIGFEANVTTLTDREWVKRFLPRAGDDPKKSIKSDRKIEDERSRFLLGVFGAGD